MQFIYFENVKNAEDLKAQFKKFAFQLHTDVNPEIDRSKFQQMKKEHDYLKKTSKWQETFRVTTHKSPPPKEPSKPTYTHHRPKPPPKPKSDLREMMDAFHDFALEREWKPIAGYYRFRDYCIGVAEVPDLEDLQYYADLLGYKKGWAYFQQVAIQEEVDKNSKRR